MKKFNRSQWTKNRWKIAGEQQSLYNEKFNSNKSKREFYKTDNVLTQNIIKYKVTYEMKNTETDYQFFIPQNSYTIYAIKGIETKDKIEEITRTAILEKFRAGQRSYINKRLIITPEERTIRGVENEPLLYDEVDYELLKFKNSYTLDSPKIKLKKTSKNKSIFDYEYNLEL